MAQDEEKNCRFFFLSADMRVRSMLPGVVRRAAWARFESTPFRATAAVCVGATLVIHQTRHAGIHSTSCTANNNANASVLTDSPAESFANLHHLLSARAPCIPVASQDVRVLSSPTEFYDTILELVRSSQKRVLLSSLYLGTGSHELALVAALRARMAEQPDLQVDVLLDFLRGTRQVGADKQSSVTAVRPLLQEYASEGKPSRFRLSLVHVPPPAPPVISALRAWLERTFFTGNKTREITGVHHMKFYVFDDYTIISGSACDAVRARTRCEERWHRRLCR